ncbi:hypothetical protein GGU11DRAFT_566442 [Lentinula aff. detonsa]|nr:hypothetical protein GGU11DRAFT_566442 [Lentinula aff. detonsa]
MLWPLVLLLFPLPHSGCYRRCLGASSIWISSQLVHSLFFFWFLKLSALGSLRPLPLPLLAACAHVHPRLLSQSAPHHHHPQLLLPPTLSLARHLAPREETQDQLWTLLEEAPHLSVPLSLAALPYLYPHITSQTPRPRIVQDQYPPSASQRLSENYP